MARATSSRTAGLRPGRTEDEQYMRMAVRLAARGRGAASPNPLVGAVVVKDGRVVGKGYHRRFGTAHAEAVALERAGRKARGSTLYVNLEPCCHYGHTPPCVDKVVECGVARVCVGTVDPDERVNGKGIAFLRRHGIRVETGVLRDEAKTLNEAYLKWARTGLPFVTLKMCESLDGRIAGGDGRSEGLGSEEELSFVHSLRADYDAVLVGAGTVLADDPRLTVRKVRGRNPHRIVVDSRLSVPSGARVFRKERDARVFVAAVKGVPGSRVRALRARGADVWLLPGKDGRVSLRSLLARAGSHAIQSMLVEGGAEVASSLLRQGLVDKVYVAVVPKILGGARGVWPRDIGVKNVGRALQLKRVRTKRLGPDVLFEGYL